MSPDAPTLSKEPGPIPSDVFKPFRRKQTLVNFTATKGTVGRY